MPDDVGASLRGYRVRRHLNGRRQIAKSGRNMHRKPRIGSCRPELAKSLRETQLVNSARTQTLDDAAHLCDGVLQAVAQTDAAFGQVGVGTQVRRPAVELQCHSRQLRTEPIMQVSPNPPALLLAGDNDALPAGLKISGKIRGMQHTSRATSDVAQGRGLLGPEAFSPVPVTYPQDANLSAAVNGW
jgi:hypothetical protein